MSDRSTATEQDHRMWLQEMNADDLRALVTSLPVIEQAKGLLMGFYGVGPDVAFDLLTRWSRNHNIKLRTICADLTAAAAQPDPVPFGALQRYLASQGTSGRPDTSG